MASMENKEAFGGFPVGTLHTFVAGTGVGKSMLSNQRVRMTKPNTIKLSKKQLQFLIQMLEWERLHRG